MQERIGTRSDAEEGGPWEGVQIRHCDSQAFELHEPRSRGGKYRVLLTGRLALKHAVPLERFKRNTEIRQSGKNRSINEVAWRGTQQLFVVLSSPFNRNGWGLLYLHELS
jgi:hypothetical protein